MLKNTTFVITAGSFYFLIFLILLFSGLFLKAATIMFLLSPILICWMVYIIIRYGKYSGKELRPDEEWVYGDKEKEELGIM